MSKVETFAAIQTNTALLGEWDFCNFFIFYLFYMPSQTFNVQQRIIKCWHFKRQLFSGTRLIEIWRAKPWISVDSKKFQLKILTRMSTGWRGLGKFFVSNSAWSQANAVLDMLIFDFHGKCSFSQHVLCSSFSHKSCFSSAAEIVLLT